MGFSEMLCLILRRLEVPFWLYSLLTSATRLFFLAQICWPSGKNPSFPAAFLRILVFQEVHTMPISDAYSKTDRLRELQMVFWRNPGQRLRTIKVAQILNVSESTALRYLTELETTGRLPIMKDGQLWVLAEDAVLELSDLRLTAAEAAALFVSGRLLAQIYDERNAHVISALLKLVGAFPQTLASHQHRLVDMARERQEHQQGK